MKVTALLPMKANSDRVPGKNFRIINNKPLFRWILDELLAVPAISKVIINTDARRKISPLLAEDARVILRDRDDSICGDFVSMNKVIDDDVRNVPSDVYLMTHTTNPLITARTIGAALSKFQAEAERGDADSLFSVNEVQGRFYDKNISPINHDPNRLIRTQDLEPWFEENSCLYLFTKASFIESGSRIGKRPAMFVTPKLESIDIDDQADWELASALLSQRSD